MKSNPNGAGSTGSRPNRRPQRNQGGKSYRPKSRPPQIRRPTSKPGFKTVGKIEMNSTPEIVESTAPVGRGPFRILLAIHRPRYRGRAVRATALAGWEVTTLLNKQDVVGQVARLAGPPDLVVLSGDFGRQKDYAIFRAIQQWRGKGMQLVGMVEDCQTAPEAYPDSAPARLCDVCLSPPYTAATLRALFVKLYEDIRGEPAPSPKSVEAEQDDEDDDE